MDIYYKKSDLTNKRVKINNIKSSKKYFNNL